MAPHCKTIKGVDISSKMVEFYNEMAQKEGLSEKLSAIRADIVADASPLGDQLFDIIVVCAHLFFIQRLTDAQLFSVRHHTIIFHPQRK